MARKPAPKKTSTPAPQTNKSATQSVPEPQATSQTTTSSPTTTDTPEAPSVPVPSQPQARPTAAKKAATTKQKAPIVPRNVPPDIVAAGNGRQWAFQIVYQGKANWRPDLREISCLMQMTRSDETNAVNIASFKRILDAPNAQEQLEFTDEGLNAIRCAAVAGHCKFLQLMFSSPKLSFTTLTTLLNDVLIEAAMQGQFKSVRLIYDTFSSVIDSNHFHSQTRLNILHAICMVNHAQLLQWALQLPSIDINKTTSNLPSPFQISIGEPPAAQSKTQQQQQATTPQVQSFGSKFTAFNLLLQQPQLNINVCPMGTLPPLSLLSVAQPQLAAHDAIRKLYKTRPDLNPNLCSAQQENPHPIHFCIEFGSPKTLSVLLEHPAIDPNVLNKQGFSALAYAYRLDKLEFVPVLLADARIDPSIGRITPLMGAILSDKVSIVQHALATIPNIDIRQKGYFTDSQELLGEAIHLAARAGSREMIEFFLTHPDINPAEKSTAQHTILHYAAMNKDKSVLDAILTIATLPEQQERFSQLDFNAVDPQGCTVLSIAAAFNHLPHIKLLLDSPRIDVNAGDADQGANPLMLATANSFYDCLAALLQHPNININITSSNFSLSPFKLAIYQSRQIILDAILQAPQLQYWPQFQDQIDKKEIARLRGQSPDDALSLTNLTCCPLVDGFRSGSLYLLQQLHKSNKITSSPLNIYGIDLIFATLLGEGGIILQKPVIDFVFDNLSSYFDINFAAFVDTTSTTPTHTDTDKLTLHRGKLNTLMKAILFNPSIEKGKKNIFADQSQQDQNGTYLVQKIISSCPSLDINYINHQDNGNSALHYAVLQSSTCSHLATILESCPLSLNLNINIQNAQGKTPLLLAIQLGHTEHVKLLLRHQNIDLTIVDNDGNDIYSSLIQILDLPLARGQITKLFVAHRGINCNSILRNEQQQGTTIVHKCVQLKRLSSLIALFGYNHVKHAHIIDINTQNALGNTALHIAVQHDYLAGICFLLAHTNIDTTIVNNDGMTAMQLAIHLNRPELVPPFAFRVDTADFTPDMPL